MKTKLFTLSLITAAACLPLLGHAQAAPGAAPAQAPGPEMARVLSSTPVVQKVAVPQQVCSNAQVVTSTPNTGGGALLGALAGGALGSVVGQGSGRIAATALGIFGGAVAGDKIESNTPAAVQNVQQCATQTTYQDTLVGYSVLYEYAGKQYTVQMPNDPGPTLAIQVAPVGMAAPATAPVYAQPVAQAVVQQVPQQVIVVPSYAQPYYYPPVGLSIGLGGYWGGHGRWR